MTETIADDPQIVEGETTHFDLEVPDPPEEAFSVTDENSANWILRRIIAARAYADHVKQYAEAELRRAEREEQFFWLRFGPQLRTWTANELARQKTKRKSIKLPAGMLGFKTLGPKLNVLDEERLLKWARKELPKAIKVTETVLKSSLNEHFNATGEIPAGTTVESGKEQFYVR
jgi:hypothetical protein